MTLEGGDPVELARRFASEGAARLHLVDLDGAFSGTPSRGLVERVAAAGGLPLQVGGGYRTLEAIAAALAAGADRVMVGTAALSPGFLDEAVARFGERAGRRGRRPRRAGRGRGLDASVGDVPPPSSRTRCADAGVPRLLVTSTRATARSPAPTSTARGQVLLAGPARDRRRRDRLARRPPRAPRARLRGRVAGSALLAGRFTLAEALAVACAMTASAQEPRAAARRRAARRRHRVGTHSSARSPIA